MQSVRGVSGGFGLGRTNEADRDLIEWWEQHELQYVNSYMRYKRRGTWWYMRYARWYELDGFIVRKSERQRMAKRMWTMCDESLSDHRPVCMRVNVKENRRFGNGARGRKQRVQGIRWERLKHGEIKEEYKRRAEELMRMGGGEERAWREMTGKMITAAKEVCGVTKRRVVNPWTIGKEEEIDRRKERIKVAVRSRNEKIQEMEARKRLRPRREDGAREVKLERRRTKVRNARKDMKDFLRRLERNWWNERIREDENACSQGRLGDMYI